MMKPLSNDEKPLDPMQARIVAKVRWLMLLSGVATVIGIAAVIGVIGYRFFRFQGSVPPIDMIAQLPKGARILQTAVASGRIAVTVDIGGTTEILLYDLKTLHAVGRLKLAPTP
jgi:Family of unknown function (DUF6476)